MPAYDEAVHLRQRIQDCLEENTRLVNMRRDLDQRHKVLAEKVMMIARHLRAGGAIEGTKEFDIILALEGAVDDDMESARQARMLAGGMTGNPPATAPLMQTGQK